MSQVIIKSDQEYQYQTTHDSAVVYHFPEKITVKSEKYHWSMILLHWATLIILLATVVTVLAWDNIEDRAIRKILIDSHRQIGMLVLVLVTARFSVKLFTKAPKYQMNRLLCFCIGICHYSLYSLLISIPLLGIALTLSHNTPVSLFGLVNLPNLVGTDPDIADLFTDYHVLLSWALLGLVTLHMVSALIHHYLLKDAVLISMLPAMENKSLKK